jgi:hypothetical protein
MLMEDDVVDKVLFVGLDDMLMVGFLMMFDLLLLMVLVEDDVDVDEVL